MRIFTIASLRIREKRKKNRKGKRIEHLTPIYSTEKEDALQFRQSSAIIAKASRS